MYRQYSNLVFSCVKAEILDQYLCCIIASPCDLNNGTIITNMYAAYTVSYTSNIWQCISVLSLYIPLSVPWNCFLKKFPFSVLSLLLKIL